MYIPTATGLKRRRRQKKGKEKKKKRLLPLLSRKSPRWQTRKACHQ